MGEMKKHVKEKKPQFIASNDDDIEKELTKKQKKNKEKKEKMKKHVKEKKPQFIVSNDDDIEKELTKKQKKNKEKKEKNDGCGLGGVGLKITKTDAIKLIHENVQKNH